jgi:simple sugar transport system permease protein
LIPLGAVALSLAIGAAMLLVLDVNPLRAYAALVTGATGSLQAVTTTIAKATPLLLVALGFTVAARAGVLNIGGEGQLTVGALAATAVSLALPEWPGIVLLPLCLMAGIIAGGVWGGMAGALKAHFEVNEVISTVMLNQIAIQLSNYLLSGPMIDPAEIERGTRLAQSAELPAQVWLVRLIPRTLLHAGAIIALIMAGVVFVFLWRTKFGYRIRAVGENPAASHYAGIRVPVYQILSLALAGALAGLAGAIEVQGVHRRMIEGLSSGFGFSGVVVALFGKLHPLGAIPASLLFGGLLVGADTMQRAEQVSSWLIQVILGLMVLFFVSSEIWVRYRARRQQTADVPIAETSAGSQISSASS